MEQNRKKRAITQLGWTFAGSLLFAAGVRSWAQRLNKKEKMKN